jgi:hypothetical protein
MPRELIPTVHDWTLSVGDWMFGIWERDCTGQVVPGVDVTETRICLGSNWTWIETSLPAYTVLEILLMGLALTVGLSVFLFGRFWHTRKSGP